MHVIFGGDGFKKDWDFDTAKAGKCNNVGPSKDHSNYWFPGLYHHGKDGSFERVPVKFVVYYHFSTDENGPRTMFPPGLKIIAGNPFLRHDDSATNKATKSIQWWCHDGGQKKTGGFPEGVTTCTGADGFAAEIWFPFCWDGVNEFDPKDPFAHVTYGDGDEARGGKCTGKYNIPLPQLFMEFLHDLKDISNMPSDDKTPWVLAQGDPTGAGFHADFVNGWEDGERSLSDAIKVDPSNPKKTKCFVGLSGGGPKECLDMLSDATKSDCKISQFRSEEVDKPGQNLPGCNAIQPASELNAVIQTDCAGSTAPGTNGSPVQNNTAGSASSSGLLVEPTRATSETPLSPGGSTSHKEDSSNGKGGNPPSVALENGETWTYGGCYSDLVPNRDIRTLSQWGTGKTSSECVKNCAKSGYSLAGTEYGAQCFCSNALDKRQTNKLDDSKCNMRCADSTEMCGGPSALSIYTKAGTSIGKVKRHSHRHLGGHFRYAS